MTVIRVCLGAVGKNSDRLLGRGVLAPGHDKVSDGKSVELRSDEMRQLRVLFFVGLPLLFAVTVVAQGPSTSAPYIAVLTEGLTKDHGYYDVAHGRITIMSALSSRNEAADLGAMKFPIQYLSTLEYNQSIGLIRLIEQPQSELDKIGSMGARLFNATPTDKLLQLADAKVSTANWARIPTLGVQVLEIVSDDACKFSKPTPGDDFRLILGLIGGEPTRQWRTLFPDVKEMDQLKFRVVLQFNPFTKRYAYVTSDIGKPSEATWYSNSVLCSAITKSGE
jgi:hypothetical protein